MLEHLRPQLVRDPPHLLERLPDRLLRLLGRRRGCAVGLGERSSWSSTPVSTWPTSSCRPRAIRSRSASWAASARWPLSRRSASSRSSIWLNARTISTDLEAAVLDQPLSRPEQVDRAHPLDEPVDRRERRAQQEQVRREHDHETDDDRALSTTASEVWIRPGASASTSVATRAAPR